MRNSTVSGSGHDNRRAGPQKTVVDLGTDAPDYRHNTGSAEGLAVDGSYQQPVPFIQRGAGNLLVARPEHHAVHAALAGRAGLAKTGWHTGQVEQLDDHMLQHMAGSGVITQALQKAAALAHTAVVLQQGRQQA